MCTTSSVYHVQDPSLLIERLLFGPDGCLSEKRVERPKEVGLVGKTVVEVVKDYKGNCEAVDRLWNPLRICGDDTVFFFHFQSPGV